MTSRRLIFQEGTEVERFYFEGDRIVRAHTSVYEDDIMELNKRLRAEGGVPDLELGRPRMQMSLAQYYQVLKRYPGIESGDHKEVTRTWQRVFADPDFAGLRTR